MNKIPKANLIVTLKFNPLELAVVAGLGMILGYYIRSKEKKI